MPSGFRFIAGPYSSGLRLVAALLLVVSLFSGSIHEVHHLGDTGEGACVICLIGTGGTHALPSVGVKIAPAQGEFLPPLFACTSVFLSFYSRGRLIRAPPHFQLT